MFVEDDLLPMSALQHLLFCERQCALIHIERLWVENQLTVQGGHLHRRAHDGPDETRDGVRIVRGSALRSLRLGLVGQADVIEFPIEPPGPPMPVEYKRGIPKSNDADRVQLCAQAMALEEMSGTEIPRGAIFYGRTRRRLDVPFDAVLRLRTEQAARRLHEMIGSRVTPRAMREPKCASCSLLEVCMPDAIGSSRSAAAWFDATLAKSRSSAPADEEDW